MEPERFFRRLGLLCSQYTGLSCQARLSGSTIKGPPAERKAEDQPFFHVPRSPEDPRTRVDISSGSASLTASQLLDQENMSHKSAAAASTALSLAEFIDNYPGMPEGARAAMLLLKLDIVSFLHYAWREVHNKMFVTPLHCTGLSRENSASHRRGPEASPPSRSLQGNYAVLRGVG